jgi:putative FmdB family regulatory protein
MPLYTYRCSNCGVQFDQQQKFTDDSLVKCPECGKKTLQKVYSPVGVVFKGSGFYATDHRSPSGMTNTEEKFKSESESNNKMEEKKSEEKKAEEKKSEEKKPAKEKNKTSQNSGKDKE